jgi:hypothetical protein
MFYRPNNLIPARIKSNPDDVAPMIFVIDVIRSEHYKNPIIPIPVRVDKVSNGEFTSIILPSTHPQIEQDDQVYFIDVVRLLTLGFQNLMSYTAIKFNEITYRPLNIANISTWWENTRKFSCNFPTYIHDLEVVLHSYLEAYIEWKSSGDMIHALISYSDKIIDLCNRRLTENKILYQFGKKEITSRIYTERKDGKKIPQIWQVDRITLENGKVRTKAFVPHIIYDDLLECFLSNKAELDRGELEVINFIELENLKVLRINPIRVKDPLKEILLSSPQFDKVLVERK